MKKTILITAIFVLSHSLIAQKTTVKEFASVDRKALQLPDSLSRTTSDIAAYINANFKTEQDKARAIFIWVASNIQYDLDNMFAINFYELKEEKIAIPLRTRKGICENYAALFNDICLKSGISSYVIEGYTRQNGSTDNIPHAWCAAMIDSTWYLFDPTWGSGYISNGKFYKKINNSYFKVNPSIMIKSHMPFDYLWQFLNYPVTNQEFYVGKTQQNKGKPFFNYADSIAADEKLSLIDRLNASSKRIETNGVKNSMIFDRLQHIRQEIENEKIKSRNKEIELENQRQNDIISLYNSASADYNDWVVNINKFIDYRNRQFMPIKPDAEIQGMLDAASSKLADARRKLTEIVNPDSSIATTILQLSNAVQDADDKTKDQQIWLKQYFSKGKIARKSMFYKYSWMGVPLN